MGLTVVVGLVCLRVVFGGCVRRCVTLAALVVGLLVVVVVVGCVVVVALVVVDVVTLCVVLGAWVRC